ncbi:MAG: 16S rRNA (guanine(527)-N(7))-methyltransferase RsmG [Terracidiphilus sp.]
MSEPESGAGARLNALVAEAELAPLTAEELRRFKIYLSLYLRWNARLNLSSVRDEEDILSRHFVESIACAQALPAGIRTLLDFGSGAGLPGISIALSRPEIAVTLAESQGKKAAFLQEAVRVLGIPAAVYAGRAESIAATFDCVTLRAVDRMPQAVKAAARLIAPGGWLVLMTTRGELPALQAAAGTEFSWPETVDLPGSKERVLALGELRIVGL